LQFICSERVHSSKLVAPGCHQLQRLGCSALKSSESAYVAE
jgi:hypothetical protein